MRSRYLAVVLLMLAGIAGFVATRRLYAQNPAPATPIPSPAAQAFLVILGVGDTAATTWDGSITATGATILNLQGWRFSGNDSITGTTWTMATRSTGGPPGVAADVQENGVIVTISAASAPVTFNVPLSRGTSTSLRRKCLSEPANPSWEAVRWWRKRPPRFS